MIFTFVLPGLLSTILELPADSTSTSIAAATTATASSAFKFEPTTTITSTVSIATTTSSCALTSTVFPDKIPGVAIALPTGTYYYYQCGSSTVGIDLAVSGTSTITYPALNSSTALPSGYTQISASNGQAVATSNSTNMTTVTFAIKTATSGAPLSTLPIISDTNSAPSASATHSGARNGRPLPQSLMGLAIAVGLVVLVSL